MMRKSFFLFLCILFSLFSQGAPKKLVRGVSPEEINPLTEAITEHICTRAHTIHPLEVESVYYYKNKTVEIYFSPVLSEQPLTSSDIEWIYASAKKMLGSKFPKCTFRIFTDKEPVENLASKWFSGQIYSEGLWMTEEGKDALKGYASEFSKLGKNPPARYSFVKSSKSHLDTVKVSFVGHSSGMGGSSTEGESQRQWVSPVRPDGVAVTKGLEGRNIALWNSHGSFYNSKKGDWSWQRPHLFQTCEGMLTADIALNYLVPMLENAGAYVVIPRERDLNTDEVIVDDGDRGYSESGSWSEAPYPGFGHHKAIYREGDAPFSSGGARMVKADSKGYACWSPVLPKAGEYAVYVSYQSLPASAVASYTVHHCGQKSVFHVNQRMGGGTWVYLGTFFFDTERGDGAELRNGVTLSSRAVASDASGQNVVTADAVKFGGGYGNVSRNGEVSGLPRCMEGARYWLQYAGMPENLYTPFEGKNDYKDDYTSRAIWVNALSGGSEVNPYMSGYGVPVDLSFALHTDAGFSANDSIVGTLAIHTTESNGRDYLADGRGRYISRELCDIIQTSVVSDLRSVFDPSWSRRGMWDKSYFECREPEVPSMILELLSHQNFADMRYALDPVFKFTVARAIYKGMLTFFKATQGCGYVVQPMPVTSFCAEQKRGEVRLKWSPSVDSLESSARPEGYLIYRRVVNLADATDIMLRRADDFYGFEYEGFTAETEYAPSYSLESGKVYSYKVVAVNDGGLSFPSEILSVCTGTRGEALVVNCFDRLSAPDYFGVTDPFSGGFTPWSDRGVAYKRDVSYAGDQYSFDKGSKYVDDANPGWGASYSDFDTLIACGNTFDYPLFHCALLAKAGYGCSSCSRSALQDVEVCGYSLMDVIGGKQKGGGRYETVLSQEVMCAIRECTRRGGTVIVSGAYVLSDLRDSGDSEAESYASDVLKVRLAGTMSGRGVESVSGEKKTSSLYPVPNTDFYSLERTDVPVVTGGKQKILLRYADYGPAALLMSNCGKYKVFFAGFPLEGAELHHLYTTLSAAL